MASSSGQLQRPSSVYKNACLRRWNNIRQALTSPITGEVTFSAASVAQCMYVDQRGWTALHKAAYGGAPLDVMDALVHTYAPALSMVTSQGWTPLNLACWREVHGDVVLCLMNNASECVGTESESGKTPLYCACAGVRTVDYAVLRRLVQLQPDVVLWKDNDGKGRSPLDLICSEYGPVMKRVVRLVVLEAAEKHREAQEAGLSSANHLSTVAHKYLKVDAELRDCWRKVSLMVQAAAVAVQASSSSTSNKRKRKLRVPKHVRDDDTHLQKGLLHAFSTVVQNLCWDQDSSNHTNASKTPLDQTSGHDQHRQQCSSLFAAALAMEDETSHNHHHEAHDNQTTSSHDSSMTGFKWTTTTTSTSAQQSCLGTTSPPCPDTMQLLPFLRFAVSLHPNQLEEVDEETGLTPFQSLLGSSSSSSLSSFHAAEAKREGGSGCAWGLTVLSGGRVSSEGQLPETVVARPTPSPFMEMMA